jgi:hypothetical protein
MGEMAWRTACTHSWERHADRLVSLMQDASIVRSKG